MEPIRFSLKTEFIELFKLLKLLGLCESGGLAKQVIAASQVKVNGAVETRKAFKVRPGQQIEFDGQVILVT